MENKLWNQILILSFKCIKFLSALWWSLLVLKQNKSVYNINAQQIYEIFVPWPEHIHWELKSFFLCCILCLLVFRLISVKKNPLLPLDECYNSNCNLYYYYENFSFYLYILIRNDIKKKYKIKWILSILDIYIFTHFATDWYFLIEAIFIGT